VQAVYSLSANIATRQIYLSAREENKGVLQSFNFSSLSFEQIQPPEKYLIYAIAYDWIARQSPS
jgi:hypothetical protein